MELRDFEYFAVIAEHGHLGRAAESLGLSQPALSKSLRRLESAMQAKLVKRTPKGIDLTPAGSMLISQVGKLRLSLDDVMRAVADLSQGRAGQVRIGAGAALAAELLPTACGALMQASPRATLKISVETADNLVPVLLAGELDVVISIIAAPAYEHLVQEHLFDEHMVVVSSARHQLAGRQRVTLADLAQERWALSATNVASWQWMRRAFETKGLKPPRTAMIGPTTLRLPIIAASDLIGFCATRTLRQLASQYGLTRLNAKELQWIRRIGVIYRKDAYLSPVAKRLIEIVKTTARGMRKD